MSNKTSALVAFSGGLDTSFCIKYLIHEKNMDVHTATVDTGGFSAADLNAIEQKALRLGSSSHQNLDETDNFYTQIVRYLIYGNVLRNNTYPLSVSAERIHQAVALVRYARRIEATAIVHGSTGAGNDQVRFDLVFQLLAPELEIITPIRDLRLSRAEEIEYLKKHGVDMEWAKAKYSINKGLWGTSVGGSETLTSHLPLPEDAYPHQLTKTTPETVTLHFAKGEIIGINDETMPPVEAIQALEALAAPFAIGRDMHIGDTIIGIKGRVGFEAAAASIILKAHHTLEKHVLSKWQLHWKQQMGEWYGMFLHEAQYFEPVMRDIEQFLESTQQTVTGSVTVQLLPYRFLIQGIQSPHDLMKSGFGDYGEMNNKWTGEDVKGFTKILANSTKVHFHVQAKTAANAVIE